jgi:hypothetical protein
MLGFSLSDSMRASYMPRMGSSPVLTERGSPLGQNTSGGGAVRIPADASNASICASSAAMRQHSAGVLAVGLWAVVQHKEAQGKHFHGCFLFFFFSLT